MDMVSVMTVWKPPTQMQLSPAKGLKKAQLKGDQLPNAAGLWHIELVH